MLMVLLALTTMQQAATRSVAGTYAVTFCVSECAEGDTSLVLAQGVVVLDTVRLRESGGAENLAACFHIEKRKNVYGYLAVISPARSKWWVEAPDSIGFMTYQAPDASHVVLAQLANGGFQGTGTSDGDGLAEIDVADEYVIGRRIGPADARQCRLQANSPRTR
jgi:hypothetical protein